MARSLPNWRQPETILELAELGVAGRDGVSRSEIEAAVAGLRGAPQRLRFFEMPRIDVSSTEIRRRAAAGRPIRYLVPDPVAAAVEQSGMYR